MSDKDQAAASPIAELLSTLLGGVNFIKLELKPGQSMEDAIAEYEAAEHRKECAKCAAEYEAGMKEKVKKEADLGATKAKAQEPIGYMVFALKDGKMTPVKGSFETDLAVIEKKMAAFLQMAPIQALAEISKLVGRDLMEAHEIRPVYA